jgi:hypothetical protein
LTEDGRRILFPVAQVELAPAHQRHSERVEVICPDALAVGRDQYLANLPVAGRSRHAGRVPVGGQGAAGQRHGANPVDARELVGQVSKQRRRSLSGITVPYRVE